MQYHESTCKYVMYLYMYYMNWNLNTNDQIRLNSKAKVRFDFCVMRMRHTQKTIGNIELDYMSDSIRPNAKCECDKMNRCGANANVLSDGKPLHTQNIPSCYNSSNSF